MEKEKEREKKTEREKGREKDFTGPGSSVGPVSRGVQSRWACAPGASACVLLSSLPLLQAGTKTHRVNEQFVSLWAWGSFVE